MATQPEAPGEAREQAPSSLTYAGYAGFVLIGWSSVLVPSVIRSLEHDFHQTDVGLSLFYFITSVMYGVGSLGGGFLIERVGRRVVLPLGPLLLAVGLTGEGLAPLWLIFILAAVPVAWGSGIIDGGVNGLFLDLHTAGRAGALNLLHVFYSVGALAAPLAIGFLLSGGVTWRALPIALAVFSGLLAVFLVPLPMPSGKHHRDQHERSEGERASLRPFVALAVSIALAVAAEAAVSSWLVRYLTAHPIAEATGVLSLYWAGLAVGRLLANRLVERFSYEPFTVGCILLSSCALLGALVAPWLPLAALLFGLSGLFMGPVFPMIVAIGGALYARRAAALTGGLTTAAVVGGITYPPLVGLVGIHSGLVSAAFLGIPTAGGILLARRFVP